MTYAHDVVPREIGMIRIYMKPSDKMIPAGAKRRWGAKLLYRDLVLQAKSDGVMNAIAHNTHYGYSNHGPIRESGSEVSDPHLTMCVELIGQRGELEDFCRRHGEMLAGKVIVYKHLEHWRIGPSREDATTGVSGD